MINKKDIISILLAVAALPGLIDSKDIAGLMSFLPPDKAQAIVVSVSIAASIATWVLARITPAPGQ